MIPSHSAIPIGSLRKITRTLHDSISRVATGLRVLGGNDASSQSMANSLTARAESFKAAANNSDAGIALLQLAESALLELNNLATRLKEVGIADTQSTNTSSDTAALNAEAVAISDTIDSVVSSLTFNGINVLATSARTFNIGINDAGNTQQIKTTTGIAATDINDATNSNNSMDTTLGEITQSLGNVAGGLTSLRSYQNVASTTAAHLLEAASNLQDTDFAEETAKITKQSLIKNYALAMVATANTEEIEKLKLLA
jgi:flagellin|tara:strand:- start:851 stop:1621 length:771 start_codon:yes stop_codon:yes gene_type:complete